MGPADVEHAAPLAGPHTVARRNRQIVEGALLADVAVVLLLGRIYLPIPFVRTIWRLLAVSPFVLLAERRGIRITIMAGLISYLLLAALVGPTLALTAFDTAFAAVLLAVAGMWRWPRWVTVPVMGLIYTIFDIVLPTILFAVLFRIPASTLVDDIRGTLRSLIRIAGSLLMVVNHLSALVFGHGAPRVPVHSLQSLGYDVSAAVFGHWIVSALIVAAIVGVANVGAYAAAADIVLGGVPAEMRTREPAS